MVTSLLIFPLANWLVIQPASLWVIFCPAHPLYNCQSIPAKSVSQLAWFKCWTALCRSLSLFVCQCLLFFGSFFLGLPRTGVESVYMASHVARIIIYQATRQQFAGLTRSQKPSSNLLEPPTCPTHKSRRRFLVAVATIFSHSFTRFFFFWSPAFPSVLYCCCRRLSWTFDIDVQEYSGQHFEEIIIIWW